MHDFSIGKVLKISNGPWFSYKYRTMVTRKVIRDLHENLTGGGHYSTAIDSEEKSQLNRTIINNWRDRIEQALTVDFRKLLRNEKLSVEHTNSRFDIQDIDSQGAAIWQSFVTLTDNNEKMDIVINFIVNHDHAFVYLGKSHVRQNKYSGSSDAFKAMFRHLKANEKVGHFFHTRFYDLDPWS